ncbi:MAG: hypothetical protein RIQ60_3076 [Pseudomonadota bacterium]|jgi:cellulose synthase/poly-beta-1,6-N-acetylglucosamine synthase-like glycosyltransferase
MAGTGMSGLSADAWAGLLFWVALALLVYTYAGYPVLLAVWARLRSRPPRRDTAYAPSVAIVVVGYNESARIAAKIDSCLAQTYAAGPLRVLIASDGSTDAMGEVVARYIEATAAALPGAADRRVSWLPFAERRGKAACLNDAAAACDEEIIVFTDARQRLHPEAVARLVAVLGDRDYGAVSGELVFEHDEASGFAQGVDAYWRYEKFIRRHEAMVGSVVGVTGALYAIRRECFRSIPVPTILDDVAIPMQVVMQGRRVGFEAGAIAYDRPSRELAQEKLRKVRTLAGNFQLVQLFPALLSPLHNPLWLAFFSHKLARLLAPLAMTVCLLASLWLALASPFFLAVLVAELALAALAGLGAQDALARRLGVARLARIAHAFLALNAFVVLGFLHFLRSRQAHLWAASASTPASGPASTAAVAPPQHDPDHR